MKPNFSIILLLCTLFACQKNTSPKWGITTGTNEIIIEAGILERKIALQENKAFTNSIFVDGENIINGSFGEFSVTLKKANLNAEPLGMEYLSEAGIEQMDAVKDQTDALIIKKNEYESGQNIQWADSVHISGEQLNSIFEYTGYSIDPSKTGITRLVLSFLSRKSEWEGVSANVFYEIYDGYPASRKWVEFSNQGKQWVKIENLVIDDIRVAELYSTPTLLAPASRGICSSIVAFSDSTASCGIISASEIPSKLRHISANGASGYNQEYFEWVMGPAESFESEPVFLYGFSGENLPTSSATSSVLDRCVESEFHSFLDEYILMSVDKKNSIAPVFCTWTNYNANINDSNMHEAANIASRIGFKCFQLDAGWSDTGPNGGWAVSTPKPNPQNFTDLKGLNSHILSKNMKPGLWYSIFINEQQDGKPEIDTVLFSLPLIRRAGGLGLSLCYNKSREKYVNELIYLHNTYKADYFKQDLSNVCYGDIARGHESRTLKESYLRGLRGLFSTQDEIHKQAPDVWLQLSHEIYWETPGPEADIAVLKHADSYHTAPNEYWGAGNRAELVNSSWQFDVEELQQKLIHGAFRARNLWYAHRGLPLDRIEVFGAATTNYSGSLSPKILDRQICSWLMGAPLSYSGDLTSLAEENIKQYSSRFAMLERLQQKYGVYSHFQYSGVPSPTDTDWHWWGKLNTRGCGAVVVLRGSEGKESREINIPWVQSEKNYRLKALFTNKEMGVFSGQQLQNGELKLTLEKLGQEIIEISIEE